MANLKGKSKCHECGKYGHWKSDHEKNGDLKPGVKSCHKPVETDSPGDSENGTISFNMCDSTRGIMSVLNNGPGPLLDDGSPYSSLGEVELEIIRDQILPEWNGELLKIPDMFRETPYLQYGTGEHSSEPRRMKGSIDIKVRSDQGMEVSIRHIVTSGSSQWIIGCNITKHCTIHRIGGNYLEIP